MSGRIRTIKPEILTDEVVAALSDRAWRLFVSSWLLADDYGNLRANERMIRGAIWWAHDDVSLDDVAATLCDLEASGLLDRYGVRDQVYAHVRGWEKNQRIDNAGKPRVPKPDDPEATEFRGELRRLTATIFATPRLPAAPPVDSGTCDSPRDSESLGEIPLARARAQSGRRTPTPTPTPTPRGRETISPPPRLVERECAHMLPSEPRVTPDECVGAAMEEGLNAERIRAEWDGFVRYVTSKSFTATSLVGGWRRWLGKRRGFESSSRVRAEAPKPKPASHREFVPPRERPQPPPPEITAVIARMASTAQSSAENDSEGNVAQATEDEAS